MAVEFDNVGVVQSIKNFEFECELMFHFVFFDDRFEYLFEGEHHPSFFVSAEIDISEFSRTHLLSQLKIAKAKATVDLIVYKAGIKSTIIKCL